MSEPGFFVDPASLNAYGGAAGDLAAQLGEAGGTTLGGPVAADCFGRIGREVGLTAAFQEAVRDEAEGLAAAAAALDGLATAVRRANVNYAEQDADTADAVTRAGETP